MATSATAVAIASPLPNNDATREDRRVVAVIVIVTRARQGAGPLGLARGQKANRVDLVAIRMGRVRAAHDVVRCAAWRGHWRRNP